MVGDLPDMYWALQLPPEFAEFWSLPEVSPRDLANHLRSQHGEVVSFSECDVALGMQAPLMGWNWAVILAQVNLEDLLEHNVAELRREARLQYGVPLPQFRDHGGVLHWEYIDDVGAWWRCLLARRASTRQRLLAQRSAPA